MSNSRQKVFCHCCCGYPLYICWVFWPFVQWILRPIPVSVFCSEVDSVHCSVCHVDCVPFDAVAPSPFFCWSPPYYNGMCVHSAMNVFYNRDRISFCSPDLVEICCALSIRDRAFLRPHSRLEIKF